MKIDGRAIANELLESLKDKVTALRKKGVIPTLAVVLVGDDPASLSFIRQKRLAAEKIGAKLTLDQLPTSTTTISLERYIEKYNKDPNIQGIIIQRPLPRQSQIDKKILLSVSPEKDVDGFVPDSPFNAPVAEAVHTILNQMHLTSRNIVIIGRGETAGTPIAIMFERQGITPTVVHSRSVHPEAIIRKADIVISCVGKHSVVKSEDIKQGATLIGVGMHRGEDGKLHGDYIEDDIASIASYYTPTPGGVGPVNVACLMKNLVASAILQQGG